jgi:hypothetical protein
MVGTTMAVGVSVGTEVATRVGVLVGCTSTGGSGVGWVQRHATKAKTAISRMIPSSVIRRLLILIFLDVVAQQDCLDSLLLSLLTGVEVADRWQLAVNRIDPLL